MHTLEGGFREKTKRKFITEKTTPPIPPQTSYNKKQTNIVLPTAVQLSNLTLAKVNSTSAVCIQINIFQHPVTHIVYFVFHILLLYLLFLTSAQG